MLYNSWLPADLSAGRVLEDNATGKMKANIQLQSQSKNCLPSPPLEPRTWKKTNKQTKKQPVNVNNNILKVRDADAWHAEIQLS